MLRVRTLWMTVVLLVPLWVYGQTSTPVGTQAQSSASKGNAAPDPPSHGASSRKHRDFLETIFRRPTPIVGASPEVKKKDGLPDAPSYTPLTPKQKFRYFADYAKSPFTFGSALVTAVTWQVYGDPPYGPGAAGFGESYVAALGQREIAALLERFVIPTAFHEDPRYFRAPAGDDVLQRGVYAVSRLFLTKGDNGHDRINASYLLGGFASAAIGNAYIRNRGYGSVAQDFAVNMGSDAAFNIAREFWPSVRPKNPKSKIRRLGDLLIGPQGLPNPKNPD